MPAANGLSDSDFRSIAEGGHDWESWIGPDGALRWVNAAATRIGGYSTAECAAMANYPWPLVQQDDRTTFELFDYYVAERRAGNNLPFRLLRKDGTIVWVTASWQPLYDGGGAYLGVRLSIRDTSDSLHNRYLDHFRPVAVGLLADVMNATSDMQRVYRLVTERAARALGVARVGVWLFDERRENLVCADRFSLDDNLHITGASLSMATCPRYMTAVSGDQLVVATDAMNDPVTRELALSYLGPLNIASMLDAPIVRGGKTIGVLCHEHVGRPRSWYETELAFVESLADFLTLALDTAERLRLIERNRMLASIIEALPDPVVTVTLEGMPVYLNRAAHLTQEPRQDTGLAEFATAHISHSYSAEGLQYRNEVAVPAAIRDGHWSGEIRLKSRQAEEIPVWQTLVAHHDAAGRLSFLSSILHDLRPQKQIEEQLRASDAALRALNADLELRILERSERLDELTQSLEVFRAAGKGG